VQDIFALSPSQPHNTPATLMLGKLCLPPRSSSKYLYLWRRCAELYRPDAVNLQRLSRKRDEPTRRPLSTSPLRRQESVETASAIELSGLPQPGPRAPEALRKRDIPSLCPGCGAHSQTVDPASAGYYDISKARRGAQAPVSRQREDEIYQAMLGQLQAFQGEQSNAIAEPVKQQPTSSLVVAICDRCHELRYQSRGNSIIHPSMQSIQAIIEESPHKHNHIYHVLDAADFPMSLISNLQHALNLPRLRTQNRRSKSVRYMRGRVAEVSFIITRSDLLAPKKEQVDTMLPYLQEVLRDALGRHGKNVRLGSVRCVSAKRGWWTKTVKEQIYYRGGAGWMVGKVNVGKSALFEAVYPKGRNQEDVNMDRLRHQAKTRPAEQDVTSAEFPAAVNQASDGGWSTVSREVETFQESEIQFDDTAQDPEDEGLFDGGEESSLLPPAQGETAYPVMPLVSALPGTTASPIRIPFGNGKGELIDLPGVHRSALDAHVKSEHRKEMVMKSRVVPEQFALRPGQSLLLGGLIRITSKTDDHILLAYPFVPPAFGPHVTGTHKAIAIQTGTHGIESRGREGDAYTGTITTIATDEAKTRVKCAGSFRLEWDVTKRRAGPVTDRAAGKQKAADLPFIVYSADILIEGVGWVELVCQMRRRSESSTSRNTDALSFMDGSAASHSNDLGLPEVEVYSPEGKFVGVRRPMNAWLLGGPKKAPVHKRRERPRMSISMVKRRQPARVS